MWIPEPEQFWFAEDMQDGMHLGSAHFVSSEGEESVIARLHQVVEEVTRKPMPEKKIGFY